MTIQIAGAGPAGLVAAIILASRGHAVRVFERESVVGSRFNDDYQGIENWTTPGDALDELSAFGIAPTWWQRPFFKCELYDDALRRASVRAPRPLFYCIRRGSEHPDSLDNALRRQAVHAGVDIQLGRKADPRSVHIFAGGPAGRPMALARGATFAVDLPDLACTLLSDRLAPKGYVYFLVADGQATLATILVEDFRQANARLDLAVESIERLYGVQVPPQLRRWTGCAGFSIPNSGTRGRTMVVGEAAGFQDALFGFGIRSAMVSGALAALSMVGGCDYELAWRARLLPYMKASQVNRAVFERVRPARSALWHLMNCGAQGSQVLRVLYSHTPWHQLLSPLVRWQARGPR